MGEVEKRCLRNRRVDLPENEDRVDEVVCVVRVVHLDSAGPDDAAVDIPETDDALVEGNECA